MGWICSTHRGNKIHKTFVKYLRPPGIRRRRREYNIKMDLKIGCEDVDMSSGSCEHSNDPTKTENVSIS
jgi:hypothetical protein